MCTFMYVIANIGSTVAKRLTFSYEIFERIRAIAVKMMLKRVRLVWIRTSINKCLDYFFINFHIRYKFSCLRYTETKGGYY